MQELWIVMKKCPQYSLSSHGRIKNNKTNKIVKPMILKRNGRPFLYLRIRFKGLQIRKSLGRQIYKEFIKRNIEGMFVMFKDENPENCRLDNLYLVNNVSQKKKMNHKQEQAYIESKFI